VVCFANFHVFFYITFIGTWFVCCVFIICFGLGFLLVASESYFGLGTMHQLGCFYVILCDVWIMIGVGVNMVALDR
jgi:hypothetical protein